MMKRLLLLTAVLFGLTAFAQSPEELYGKYITPETQAVLDRFEQAELRAQEAEAAARSRRTLALAGALLIGLIPLGIIGRRILRERTWKDNPAGTAKGLAIGLMGGAVLFGLNYGVFLLKIKMGDGFNTALAFLLVAAMIAGALYLLQKKGDG
jgi:hypothetical protein